VGRRGHPYSGSPSMGYCAAGSVWRAPECGGAARQATPWVCASAFGGPPPRCWLRSGCDTTGCISGPAVRRRWCQWRGRRKHPGCSRTQCWGLCRHPSACGTPLVGQGRVRLAGHRGTDGYSTAHPDILEECCEPGGSGERCRGRRGCWRRCTRRCYEGPRPW
jgi:hypothetical protein